MKLHLEQPDGQRITKHGPGWVEVSGERHEGAVMLGADFCRAIGAEIKGFADLSGEHPVAREVIGQAPAVVLVGTGAGFALAPASFVQACAEGGIGVESMDTAAACRTYNVLSGEDRHVVALLFH